ncbi:hypothetical protein DFH09DRAFT_1088918 [Mycena vulgaris]|nr:hypothetical protein DFH09DRAFT_1088918 [Mycena vulgaris]
MVSQHFLQNTAVYAAILFAAVEATTTAPIIDLGYAQYHGAVDTSTNVTTFLRLGIRYAAEPIIPEQRNRSLDGPPPDYCPDSRWRVGATPVSGDRFLNSQNWIDMPKAHRACTGKPTSSTRAIEM